MVRVTGGRAEPMLMFVQYLHAMYAFAVRACLQSDLTTGCGDGCKHGEYRGSYCIQREARRNSEMAALLHFTRALK
jgi:hypothetical protein